MQKKIPHGVIGLNHALSISTNMAWKDGVDLSNMKSWTNANLAESNKTYKMKKITPTQVFFNTMLICYLLMSFAMWSFNGKEWGENYRLTYAIFAPIISCIVYMIKKEDYENEKMNDKYEK